MCVGRFEMFLVLFWPKAIGRITMHDNDDAFNGQNDAYCQLWPQFNRVSILTIVSVTFRILYRQLIAGRSDNRLPDYCVQPVGLK